MKTELTRKLSKLQWLTDPKRSKDIHEYSDAYNDEKWRTELAKSINDTKNKEWKYEDISLFLIRIEIQKLLGRPTPYGTYKTLCKSGTIYQPSEFQIIVENEALFIPIPKSHKKLLEDIKFCKPEDSLNEEEREIPNLWNELKLDTTSIYNQLTAFISNNYSLEEIYSWIKGKELKKYLGVKTSITMDDFIEIVSKKVADDFIFQITEKKRTMFNSAVLGVYDIYDSRTQNVESHIIDLKMYHSDYFSFKCTVELYHILSSIRDTFKDITKANLKDYAPFLCSLGTGGFIVTCREKNLELMWARRSDLISSGKMWHFSFDETVNIKKDAVRERNSNDGRIIIAPDKTVRVNAYKNMYRGMYEENGLSESDLLPNRGILEIGIIKSDRLEVEILSYAMKNLKSGCSSSSQMKEFNINAPDNYLEIKKYEFEDLNQNFNNYTGKLLTPEAYHLAKLLHNKYDTLYAFYRKEIKTQGEVVKYKTGNNVFIDENCKISDTVVIGNNVRIGKNTIIEDYCYIGDNCIIGESCKIHRNVFIDDNVTIAPRVKIQNNNSIYHGVILNEGAFVGTNVCFTNDRFPRSIKRDGTPVTSDDWTLEYTIVSKGASLGAGAVIRCGITIGDWAMIGCGSVVTKDVMAETTVAGNPHDR